MFSVIIALANGQPYDLEVDVVSAIDTSEPDSAESNEYVYAPIGILAKDPDDENAMFVQSEIYELPDEKRLRRRINETHSSEDGGHEVTGPDEQNSEEPTKVPLQGIIAAIETDLVTTALLASTQLHKRQSTANGITTNNIENLTSTEHNASDANQNLFANLFNFTRAEPESHVKVPLDGLVSAVETTLINSAQNLKDTKPHTDAETIPNYNGAHRFDRDTANGIVQIQTLDGTQPLQDLNLLSPITFKSVRNQTEMDDNDGDINPTTDFPGIHETNFTVVLASDTVSLVPDDANKLAHVQHQAISKTIFQSNLAIFPTIPPTPMIPPLSTNTGNGQSTTKEESTEHSASGTVQTSPSNVTNALIEKTLALKEKLAEVQAPPVIFSQFP